jgi:hypothetical protein
MFDFAIPLKTAFKQKLDRGIPAFARKASRNRDNAQTLRRVLAESFLNGLRKGATAGKIVAGFEPKGVVPFNPEVPLSFQFAVDPVDSAICTPSGPELK